MRVGWIGLGSMGQPMALAVLRAGHALTGYARKTEARDAITAEGGTATARIEEAVADADLVCINLFSEQQVRDAVLASGALEAMRPGAMLAIHSTVSPAFVQEIEYKLPTIALLDAGFSGGPVEAATAKLTLMVGGGSEALERARPVFSAYARHIAHVGPTGSGMALKIINNLMFAANIAIARDALRLIDAHGLIREVATDTLMLGSAGSTALGILGRGKQTDDIMDRIRPYLKKDVAIARASASGLDLGCLDAATSQFAAE